MPTLCDLTFDFTDDLDIGFSSQILKTRSQESLQMLLCAWQIFVSFYPSYLW